MSTASTHSQKPSRRISSLQSIARKPTSRVRPKSITHHEAYSFALRVAYLHHLLQVRAKRKQYVNTPKAPQRVSTTVAIGDLMKDFAVLGQSKSGKFPHGFMSQLEKRMRGVMQGTEKMPGYADADIKRTFAEAYTHMTDEQFKRRMDKERRVEDLVLIFYSKATKALQMVRAPGDDSWKKMVDRHVALFVRLVSATLKDHNDHKDRPELMIRLATLEKKLLTSAQDLYVTTQQAEGEPATIEVTVPLSYAVKDMHMVQVVASIFGVTNTQVQKDIDAQKNIWTEEAALTDLKSYQHCMTINSKRTLNKEDFDLDEAYEEWKKAEKPVVEQMMLDILKLRPDLLKSHAPAASNKTLPSSPTSSSDERTFSDLGKAVMSPVSSRMSTAFDPSMPDIAALSSLSLVDDGTPKLYLEESSYTFIPTDPRAYLREVLVHAMTFDQMHSDPAESGEEARPLLSKQSIELMNEMAHHWRIPQISKLVLYIDVASQKFIDQEIGLEELDAAFDFVKNPPPDAKHKGSENPVGLADIEPSHWTLSDFALYRQTLSNLHDALLRDLYDLLQHCYESKPPSPGPIMVILDIHIYDDPSFSKNPEDLDAYAETLTEGLHAKAAEVYRGYLEEKIPQVQADWQFFHVVQLGKAVVGLCERIQKRYKKQPDIMGVNPLTILVATMFPCFESDANALIQRILKVAETNQTEVDLQDGFDLYRELVEIRRIHQDALPDLPFVFNIEELLADFVWRWIKVADEKMVDLVDQAIAQDEFQVRVSHPGNIASDEERHSVSVIDLFRIFNQTSEQIFQLNWDDDVQYAKFMTALSRTFGNGLARYCEVLEQKFTKEMDRQSPAQEAAQAQSRQEKWMQLAKDIWTNKEKIEPFQFYPESFVKLNNIEFAIMQLDKLEKVMNVDACAEVLKKNETPRDRQRRPNKYVFTIKIVEAEELKACDSNGTSDPYVVLGDEYQKRLAKTRVVMRSLSPRWDESVDITVQGPLNIIATIWDWDTFGDHDYVGRTSLKLDPAHFSDYLPREYWLNLDTQGRLLMRVSMEGERDDIQFYFGKAFRMLKRTERDMTRKITDKLSTFIYASLSRETLRSLQSNQSISVASVTSLWKNRNSASAAPVAKIDKESVLKPLFTYFDENFAIMKQTLTDASMIMVMTRLWKEVLMAVESLLVPPLSDKPSTQRPLSPPEVDVVFHWLQLLFEFFNAKDEETGEVMGVPEDVLKSPKYSELASLNFFYFESTEDLIRTSERMATATAQRASKHLSTPPSLSPSTNAPFSGVPNYLGVTSVRRTKSIMLSRNLGTMKKAKEEKRREAQADPSDDMILRILRMRPEASGYLRDRSRQKERLAASQAAEMIVRQSLAGGGAGGGLGRFGAGASIRRG